MSNEHSASQYKLQEDFKKTVTGPYFAQRDEQNAARFESDLPRLRREYDEKVEQRKRQLEQSLQDLSQKEAAEMNELSQKKAAALSKLEAQKP